MATDWIAATALRPVDTDIRVTPVPDTVTHDTSYSPLARTIYAVLIEHPGESIDPYENAHEDPDAIRDAIYELVEGGLAVRMPPQ